MTFHLNVDWYQPFEHTQHSEGAIYLTVLNLPRQERFLKEKIGDDFVNIVVSLDI